MSTRDKDRMSWHQYLQDIVTFRAHDWWGLFASLVTLLYLLFIEWGRNFILYWCLMLIFSLNMAVFIDINAHEFYH